MQYNSPRNSLDAHLNLLELQNCSTVLLQDPQPPYVAALLDSRPMRTLLLPSLEELFTCRSLHYEYKKSFQEARGNPLVALHTSGSTGRVTILLSFQVRSIDYALITGLPKPIILTVGCATVIANASLASGPEGYKSVSQLHRHEFVLSAMPMFHVGRLLTS